ncbi:phage tail protein [Desulforegula conservatrix]|uniref:phage tail protein n=1 Tax=Desulforegula conservatrix TaxID=153026 RepID=UPI0004190383|nr:tail fiber protein [Desulforegula conservatrix]
MSDPFVGEIRLWATQYAPLYWAYCDGQILPVDQYSTLYAVIGQIYGGSGSTSFALPDLRGLAPVHRGVDMPEIGQKIGAEEYLINESQMPPHSHHLMAVSADASGSAPEAKMLAKTQNSIPDMYITSPPDSILNSTIIGATGGNDYHYNIQPSLGLAFCIALEGVYPSRS